jgi:CBS domain-containing membrane protein
MSPRALVRRRGTLSQFPDALDAAVIRPPTTLPGSRRYGYTRPMPHRLRIGELMSCEVVTLTEDDTLADARRCMDQGRIRHLPVVRDGKLVGLVTHRDLLAASFSVFARASERDQRQLFARTPVRELMHDAVAVSPDTAVREGAALMVANQFGCLPVVGENGSLVGIVTEADMVQLLVRVLEAISV